MSDDWFYYTPEKKKKRYKAYKKGFKRRGKKNVVKL